MPCNSRDEQASEKNSKYLLIERREHEFVLFRIQAQQSAWFHYLLAFLFIFKTSFFSLSLFCSRTNEIYHWLIYLMNQISIEKLNEICFPPKERKNRQLLQIESRMFISIAETSKSCCCSYRLDQASSIMVLGR